MPAIGEPLATTTATPSVTASVTPLTLDRDTGMVTGTLVAEDRAAGFLPQFIRTAKGRGWVDGGGAFAYSPLGSARRAAAQPDAAFLGDHNDTLTLTAYDTDGSPLRVHATIAILGS